MVSRSVAACVLALALVGCRAAPIPSTPVTGELVLHAPPPGAPPSTTSALGTKDGLVRGGVTLYDDVPAVTKLDPALLRALRRAASRAARAGVVFYVDSGWRSPAYQKALLRQAIATYGSEQKAARWVAPPATSSHVKGEAVDIGGERARTWLRVHGSAYGLCRTYRNEPWHFELRPRAVAHGCPSMYADAAHDPRLQQ